LIRKRRVLKIAVIDGNEGLLAAIAYSALRKKVVESYFI